MGVRQGFFQMFRPRPKPPAPEPDRIGLPGEPEPVDNLGGGNMSPEEEREAVERWNAAGRRQKAEMAEVEREREEPEKKARAKAGRTGGLRGLLARLPLVSLVDKQGTPLLPRYGLVTGWPWPGFTPMATPAPSAACPDSLVEHRRRIRRYESLPSDSDEREDLAEMCWAHGGYSTGPTTCPTCFPGRERRRQREAARKARGEGGFSFAIWSRPDDGRPSV